jgi:hypothetical protein
VGNGTTCWHDFFELSLERRAFCQHVRQFIEIRSAGHSIRQMEVRSTYKPRAELLELCGAWVQVAVLVIIIFLEGALVLRGSRDIVPERLLPVG